MIYHKGEKNIKNINIQKPFKAVFSKMEYNKCKEDAEAVLTNQPVCFSREDMDNNKKINLYYCTVVAGYRYFNTDGFGISKVGEI